MELWVRRGSASQSLEEVETLAWIVRFRLSNVRETLDEIDKRTLAPFARLHRKRKQLRYILEPPTKALLASLALGSAADTHPQT